jgi:hypothetical protein
MATEQPSLTPDEIQTVKAIHNAVDGKADIDKLAQATGTSRRDILKIAAALGIGTIGGGITARELVQEAQAAASTTDGDGNVGTPQNPVDIFADGISTNSVDTDKTAIDQVAGAGYPTTDQTISPTTFTKLAFDTVEFDDTSVVDFRPSSNDIEIQTTGTYDLSYYFTWNGGSLVDGDLIGHRIYINGANETYHLATASGSGNGRTQKTNLTKELSSGDVLDVRAYHNSGGDRIIKSGNRFTRLQIKRVG